MFGQSVKKSSKAAYGLGHKMGCQSILYTACNACMVKGTYQNVESENLYYNVFNCFLCLRFVSCVTVTAQLYNCSVG